MFACLSDDLSISKMFRISWGLNDVLFEGGARIGPLLQFDASLESAGKVSCYINSLGAGRIMLAVSGHLAQADAILEGEGSVQLIVLRCSL